MRRKGRCYMAYIMLKWINLMDETDKGEWATSLPVNIGRASGNDLVLTATKIGVSRQHARLSREDADVVLTDLQSKNGVYVGNERISKTAVSHKTTFIVGAYRMTVTIQHRCNNEQCQKLVDVDLSLCPWCGRFMADAMTQEGEHFYV
ncbi:MAG: FHA domain-containing protein [Chloroflexi bacterium]|nr:FHA domain-containing protein [Chloroflexota bacterium]